MIDYKYSMDDTTNATVPECTPDETPALHFDAFIKIYDPNRGEIYVEQRD